MYVSFYINMILRIAVSHNFYWLSQLWKYFYMRFNAVSFQNINVKQWSLENGVGQGEKAHTF